MRKEAYTRPHKEPFKQIKKLMSAEHTKSKDPVAAFVKSYSESAKKQVADDLRKDREKSIRRRILVAGITLTIVMILWWVLKNTTLV